MKNKTIYFVSFFFVSLIALILALLSILLFTTQKGLEATTDQLKESLAITRAQVDKLQGQADEKKPAPGIQVTDPGSTDTPADLNASEYNYIYEVVKNVYEWDGLPQKLAFHDMLGVDDINDGYTWKTKQLSDSIIDWTALTDALTADGWTEDARSRADSPSSSSVVYNKSMGGEALRRVKINVIRPFVENTERTITIYFDANK